MRMNRELLLDLSMSLAVAGIAIGLLMMIGTAAFLNRSPKRFRIFELGYSKDSAWYKNGKVDFFTANYVINHVVIAGLRLRSRSATEHLRRNGSPLAPFIHLNENYNKLFNEFPIFVKWELAKVAIIIPSLLFGLIGVGLNKGWW